MNKRKAICLLLAVIMIACLALPAGVYADEFEAEEDVVLVEEGAETYEEPYVSEEYLSEDIPEEESIVSEDSEAIPEGEELVEEIPEAAEVPTESEEEVVELSADGEDLEFNSGAITITKQPENTTAAPKTTAKFAVEATGDSLTYLWQYKLAADGSKWTNWTSKKTAEISVAYNAERDGMKLRCVITDANGEKVTSKAVTLTYSTASVITITKQPANATVAPNKSAKFAVEATGDSLTYLWQYKLAVEGSKWTNWTSKKTAEISVAYNAERDGMQLRCVITDANGEKVNSKAVVLTYAEALAITKQPVSTSVAPNKSAKFAVEATGTGLTYLWQYKLAAEGSKWTNWTSKKTAEISVAYNAERDGMQLRCVITDANGTKVTSKAVTLTYVDTSVITSGNGVYKKLDDGSLKLVSYTGTEKAVVIPASVEGMTVTQIGEDAFKDNQNITSISLPNSITVIGARAFKNCSNLSNMSGHD